MQQRCCLLALTWGERFGFSWGSPQKLKPLLVTRKVISLYSAHFPHAWSGDCPEMLGRLYFLRGGGGEYCYKGRIKMGRRNWLESRRNLARRDEA